MKIKVFRQTSKGWELFHSGVVVGETTTMFRVFNAETDINPGTAEYFAKSAKLIYCQTHE